MQASWHNNIASASPQLLLQEHDYIIRLSSSSASQHSPSPPSLSPSPEELDSEATDLRLGLGLGLGLGLSVAPSKKADLDRGDSLAPAASATSAAAPRLLPAQLKANGTKRAYKDTMGTDAAAAAAEMFTDQNPMACKNGAEASSSAAAADMKPPPQQQQMNVVFVAGWGAAAPSSASSSSTSSKVQHAVIQPTWAASGVRESSSSVFSKASHEKSAATAATPEANEPPPSKDRVVGWPPIHSYRKSTFVKPPPHIFPKIHTDPPKPSEMFVKVNMDGVTVGRKLDLNAHASYEGLLLALEEMFQPSTTTGGTPQSDAKHFRLLNGSEYVLTYEDKDGDWMLVGDVPWSMFTSTVRRLRIQRRTDATGLAPRASEKLNS